MTVGFIRFSFCFLLVFLFASAPALLASEAGGESHAALEVPTLWVLPFALMLLSIAILPLVREHWWEHNLNKLKVAIVLSLPVLVYFLFFLGSAGHTKLEHSLVEYFQFISLLGSLYIISGGILLSGTLDPTPRTNATILAIGALLASFIGTTGAAMLLIRPLLTANATRRFKVHTVIFFIFCVANIGGLLTPLGDPPLFLGYLRGVPFEWTFRLWPAWLAMNGVLILLYLVIDLVLYRREGWTPPEREGGKERLRLHGLYNFLFLGGVVASVAAAIPSINTHDHQYIPWRELVMGAMVVLSLVFTPKVLRERNQFNFHAIIEVAYLFIGIFITMVPALVVIDYLASHGKLPISEPWHFYWFTGSLSSFLDNAPTYVTFFEAARGLPDMEPMIAGVYEPYLVAISLGAVFMGAMTYIGNGPNFMVKAIAESQKVKMPSFFGYMAWSVGILIPFFVLLTLVMNALEWVL